MDYGYKSKVAMVTGTGSQIGMGKAIALTLAKEGCDIVSCDINFDGAKKTADEVKASGRKAVAYKLDVSDNAEVQNVVQEAVKELGKIDILVNTAGGAMGIGPKGPLPIPQEEVWQKDVAVNFFGSMYCARAVLPGMTERKYGKIINFSSAVAISGMPGASSYAGAKAAVITFTKCLSMEAGSANINVNCLAPTMVMTNFGTHASMDPKMAEGAAARMPMKRLTTAQDIANLVAFLASDASRAITGQVITI
jgi:3-oxoacyl-[acyl-carrier protein] reductase